MAQEMPQPPQLPGSVAVDAQRSTRQEPRAAHLADAADAGLPAHTPLAGAAVEAVAQRVHGTARCRSPGQVRIGTCPKDSSGHRHRLPQPPQFLASVLVEVQTPLQTCCPT